MRLLNLQKQFCSWQKLKIGDSRNFPLKKVTAQKIYRCVEQIKLYFRNKHFEDTFFNDKLKITLRFITLKISICNICLNILNVDSFN